MVTPGAFLNRQAHISLLGGGWLRNSVSTKSGHAGLRQMSRNCLKLRAPPGAGAQDDQSTLSVYSASLDSRQGLQPLEHSLSKKAA